MERLTFKYPAGKTWYLKYENDGIHDIKYEAGINKLAAYEDTNLEPSEVAALKAEYERQRDIANFYRGIAEAKSATEIQFVLSPYLKAIEYAEHKDKQIAELKAEIESQEYQAYKIIKDKIKGCLDREKAKDKQLAALKAELAEAQELVCKAAGNALWDGVIEKN